MENHLHVFICSLSSYVREVKISTNDKRIYHFLIPNLTRKFSKSAKIPLTHDFSLPRDVFSETESGFSIDMVMQQMVQESQNWTFHIHQFTLSNSWISIFLDRTHAFKQVLSITLMQCVNYGRHSPKNQTIFVTSDMIANDAQSMDLSQLRVSLVRKVCGNLLRVIGYDIVDMEAEDTVVPIKLFITHKSSNELVLPVGYHRLFCAAVLNAKHNSKENETMACDYYTMRLEDMKTMSQHKYGSDALSSMDFLKILPNLQDASVTVDLLCIKPGHTVTINLDTDCVQNRVTNTKGASFFMYNYARISEILKKYYAKVEEGYYPPLMPIEDIDFSLLCSEDEWELLFNFVLRYPTIIEDSVAGLNEGNLRPDLMCSFVSSMCNSFSGYYRRTRILTEPRKHLLPVMFARLYLLRGIQQVLHNALLILNISPIAQM